MTNPTDNLTALEAAATKGPWHGRKPSEYASTPIFGNDKNGYICTTSGNADNDAALICTLRNIAPELIAFLPNADHADDCESLPSADDWKNDFQDRPCTCGLDALMAKIEQETGE